MKIAVRLKIQKLHNTLKQTLNNLGLDYLDLYLIHWPVVFRPGVTNFSIKKLDALICESGIKPEVNQIELHPFLQQNKMIAYCKSNQIFLTAYSPLGSSDRPAAWKSQNEPSLIENPIILEIAAKHNCTPAQVLIKWAVVRGTAVIPKSVTPTHLIENLAAMDIFLSEQDMEAIATLDAHSRYIPGDSWEIPGSPYADGNLVKDVVNANILASKAKESCIVNCGSGKATSFNHIVEQLNAILGLNRKPEYIENPFEGAYQNHTECDMSLAKEKIGFVPEYSFEKGLMDYYRSGFLI